MTRCLVCLRSLDAEGEHEAHPRCLRTLFGTSRIPRIDVDPRSLHLLGQEMAGRLTLSGVQRKISLGMDRATLRIVAGASRYILKPQAVEYPFVPENEHATMLAVRAFGLEVPPCGLVRLADDSLAFVIRRFDRTDAGRRIPMEDLCQLAELSPADKYRGSAESAVRLLRRYSAAPAVDLLRHWRLQVVSWWVGNGDLHLKNLSLLTRERGKPRLSPVYDVVNTRLVIPGDALALPVGGKRSRLDAATWRELATYSGLQARLVRLEATGLLRLHAKAAWAVSQSFLPETMRQEYGALLLSRRAVVEELAG
jgi:serine/threonine-protein kinase HipA